MSGIADNAPKLSLCNSAPHRAVLGLLAVALGRAAYDGLFDDLAASPPEQLAAIANQGHAQTILHSAFVKMPALEDVVPLDLRIYFAEMQRANSERNAQAKAQLAEISDILAPHGILVVALKGAADVLDPLHQTPAHRYISDLDLLVPADQISEAARLLRDAKGLPVTPKNIAPGPHHHLAQIVHPDFMFTIELHIRPGSDAVSQVLSAKSMIERSKATHIPGVLIPSVEDRLLQHVLHGMELRHDTAALNLRLLSDHMRYLQMTPDATLKQALSRLNDVGLVAWLQDLTALSKAMEGIPPAADNWAGQALARFGMPQDARMDDTVFWIKRYVKRFIQNGDYRKQALRKILSPTAWAEFVQFHRERLGRFK